MFNSLVFESFEIEIDEEGEGSGIVFHGNNSILFKILGFISCVYVKHDVKMNNEKLVNKIYSEVMLFTECGQIFNFKLNRLEAERLYYEVGLI